MRVVGRWGTSVRSGIQWWWPSAHGSGRSRATVGSSSTSRQARTVAGHGYPQGGAHSRRSGGAGVVVAIPHGGRWLGDISLSVGNLGRTMAVAGAV
jgi:hypothetical protein